MSEGKRAPLRNAVDVPCVEAIAARYGVDCRGGDEMFAIMFRVLASMDERVKALESDVLTLENERDMRESYEREQNERR